MAQPGGQAQGNPDEQESQEDIAGAVIRSSPPWLVSALFHMVMLIIFGLIVVVVQSGKQVELESEIVYAEQLGVQTEIDSPLGVDNADKIEEPVITPPNLKEVPDPFAAPSKMDIRVDGTTATSDIPSTHIGLALSGRQEGSKKALLGRYGGNATTEGAVQKGLEWLARQQMKDGSWSLAGPYGGGVHRGADNLTAATAMALLAFQGAGNTHQVGKWKDVVRAGWNWLLKQQGPEGEFFREGVFNHRFYTQGQCTIALCELYGMSKDPAYKSPAEKAIQFCVRSQAADGGWRYTPGQQGDVSVTGWVIMGLQSGRMAGLEVPSEALNLTERFLDRIAMEGGSRYPYQEGRSPTTTMTAEALLCRQYLGWPRDDKRLMDGAKWITQDEHLISFNRNRNVYYWYYATQVCHHLEGEYWKKWNSVMRQALPEQQVKAGKEAGSWDPDRPSQDEWAPHGGRLYVTCLSIYMLEVYYRHMPLYGKVYSSPVVRRDAGAAQPPLASAQQPPAETKPAEKKE